jgi:hypothetical protein
MDRTAQCLLESSVPPLDTAIPVFHQPPTNMPPEIGGSPVGKPFPAVYCSVSQNRDLLQNRQNRHMSSSLPLLLAVLTSMAGLPPVARGSEPRGNQAGGELVTRAALAAGSHDSVSASVRLRAEFYGRPMVGGGVYLQQGRGDALRLRFQLRLQLADATYSAVVICDGRYLWRDEQQPSGRRITRVDMGRVRDLFADSSVGSAPPRPEWLLEGGLPALMASLAGRFEFVAPETVSLSGTGSPAYVVRGSWRGAEVKATADTVDGQNIGGKPAGSMLPETVPGMVMLVLGREDLFPYLIEFHRQAVESARHTQTGSRPILRLELFAVTTGVVLDEANFSYRPGEQEWVDVTDSFLKQYGLQPAPPVR